MSLIVIVDDRVSNRHIFTRLASAIEEGIVVEAFPDPPKALEWLADHTPDLIITDYKMPEMDGTEFIRHLRRLPHCADIPVVVITVYEERNFRLCALEAGATDFLTSPVDHHEFVTRARNLLKMRFQQLELAKRATSLELELEHSEHSRQQLIRDSSERLAQVIDSVPAMITATSPDGRIMFTNAYTTKFAGFPSGSTDYDNIFKFLGGENRCKGLNMDSLVMQNGEATQPFEQELFNGRGEKRVFMTIKAPLRSSEGEICGILTNAIDITERKQMESHLHHMAYHDPLTHLPNRSLLADHLSAAISRYQHDKSMFALHLIDLDGFKKINDMLGHSVGDKFLCEIADTLRDNMRESDMISRLGGDEFAIIQLNVATKAEAAQFAERIIALVGRVCPNGDERFRAATSVGIVLHPLDGKDAEQLLKNADMAMYRAKSQGGNNFCFYLPDMENRARIEAALDAELRHAIETDQFRLFYQPIIDVGTNKVAGAEALIRWMRPGHGLMTPNVFLPRCEDNGLILEMNEWVLFTACSEAKLWQELSGRSLSVSVNMSPAQFQKRTVPLLVTRVLAETGLQARHLDLELTETDMIHDLNSVAADLRQLNELGVKTAIDDFGTGYSSMSYLKRLPVGRVKIDRSFIRNIEQDPIDLAIVRAIIALARSLDLEVVAEGVETADQQAIVRWEGCDLVQGYYFGKPMPAEDFRALISAEKVDQRRAEKV